MKKIFVKIKIPNRQILVKGTTVRTPVNFIINQSEVANVKTLLRGHSITDYVMEIYDEKKGAKSSTKIIRKKPAVKNSKKTNTSLDKFIN